MTIAVDLGRKATKNKKNKQHLHASLVKQVRVKVLDVFATVSARAGMRVCVEGGGGGGAIIQKEFVNCSMFDVINIVAINGYIFIQFICFTCTVPCSHNETSICMFLEYTFDDILTTVHTSESEISTGWSQ